MEPPTQLRWAWLCDAQVCAAKGNTAAALLDTKGPEIRTAMLRDGKDIELEAGQPIIVEAVGDRYTEFQGYKDDKETRIGLSYDKLCQSVKEGNRLLLADGSISIRVEEILSKTELRGTVLNSKKLGQRKVQCLGVQSVLHSCPGADLVLLWLCAELQPAGRQGGHPCAHGKGH
jgi:pyruvate kinase